MKNKKRKLTAEEKMEWWSDYLKWEAKYVK